MAGPTNADIMRAINEQSRAIGDLEGTVRAIDAKLDSHSERLNNHSSRLRKMESGMQWYAGAATVLGGFFGAAIAWFKDKL